MQTRTANRLYLSCISSREARAAPAPRPGAFAAMRETHAYVHTTAYCNCGLCCGWEWGVTLGSAPAYLPLCTGQRRASGTRTIPLVPRRRRRLPNGKDHRTCATQATARTVSEPRSTRGARLSPTGHTQKHRLQPCGTLAPLAVEPSCARHRAGNCAPCEQGGAAQCQQCAQSISRHAWPPWVCSQGQVLQCTVRSSLRADAKAPDLAYLCAIWRLPLSPLD